MLRELIVAREILQFLRLFFPAAISFLTNADM